MTSLRFDESLVNGHFNDILNSFRIYVEDIQPLIINIEELKSEFPSEILNEIRAMYTHLCRAYMAGTDDDVVSNIEKLKTHTKRALLDCYKNSCIVIIDQRKFFFQKYKGVDLSLISEGDFLRKELNAYRQTIDTLKAAKKAEGVNTNTDKLFALYQEAYQIIRNTIQQRRGAAKAAPLAISGGCGGISQFQSRRALGVCRGRRFSYRPPFPRHP